MKAFLLLAFVLLGSVSAMATPGDPHDCRSVTDGASGKYCHYQLGECSQADCEATAKCAVEKWSYDVSGRRVSAQLHDSSSFLVDGEDLNLHRIMSQQVDCHGKQCLRPLHVVTK